MTSRLLVGLGLATCAGFGAYLLYTAVAFGWRGLGLGPRPAPRQPRSRDWLVQAGLHDVRPAEFLGAVTVCTVFGAAAGAICFAGAPAAVVGGMAAGAVPVLAARTRRQRRRVDAQESWPRLLEAVRLLTVAAGRSIPQALFEVGHTAPAELKGAFEAAEREWLLTTDLGRSLAVLTGRLADPAVDAIAETLLVAHEVGGADLDGRLAMLIDDRRRDVDARRDAAAQQAGVRFARRFVLLVPAGMAAAGMSVGSGRSAYATPGGQAAVTVGLVTVAACWVWAGRLMEVPGDPRVFVSSAQAEGHP